ncbi:MAG: ROK family protein [Bacteroidota bacterium]
MQPASASLPPAGHASTTHASTTAASSGDFLVGVDIGGTNLRCALVAVEQPTQILARVEAHTPESSEAVVSLIAEMAVRCARQIGVPAGRIAGLGCVCPGILDAATGVVHLAVNLGWKEVPLRARLTAETGLPVALENDVNAGAMAEYRFGEATPPHSLVYLTVSTGIACGIIVEGRVLHGVGHAAGELGFLRPNWTALDDPAQTLEEIAGGAGLARRWHAAHLGHGNGVMGNGAASTHTSDNGAPGSSTAPLRTTAVDVYEAARAEQPQAARLVREAIDGVALAAAAVSCVLNPEVLVLGGSIAAHEAVLRDRVQTHVQAAVPFAPRIESARLGHDAPLLGAIAVAERHRAGWAV